MRPRTRRRRWTAVAWGLAAAALPHPALSQDDDRLGAWGMVFWSTPLGDGPWGLQGDVQFRDFEVVGDLEQLLLRGGLTWSAGGGGPTLTGGVAHITSGTPGEGDETTSERRLYQEVLLRQSVGSLLLLRHRYRSEQRWIEGQDLRTRYRYALFVDVPLNGRATGAGALYLAFYDEVFLNGELNVGSGRRVERFDRNRLYAAAGFGLSDGVRVQGGYMLQTLAGRSKGQLQLSLHASF